MSSVKTQSRKMSTTHTWFWHVRLINSKGKYHSHPGWVVKVEREGNRSFNPDSPAAVESTWREAIQLVQANLDNGPGGEVERWELTVDILEWRWGKSTNVAELY